MVNGIPSVEQELRMGAELIVSAEVPISFQIETEKEGDEVVKYIITFEQPRGRDITEDDIQTYRRQLEYIVRENTPPNSNMLEIKINRPPTPDPPAAQG